MTSLLGWIRALVSTVLTMSLAALAILAVATIAGLVRLDVITSGSMEPTYGVGDLVVLLPTDAERIQVGDVVALHSENLDATVAHRVASIDESEGTVRLRGDANDGPDPEIYALADAPRVVFAVPHIGGPIYAAQANPAAFGAAFGVLIVALLLLWHLATSRPRKKSVEDPSTSAVPPHTPHVQHT